jgi:1-deoxy-D-xylulose-5-phosphate reductoisomerase
MVDYVDGSVLAQLGNPDMRTPIAHALAWPERIDSGVDALDLPSIAHMDFSKPSFERFPCLGHAYAAIRAGGNAPTVLNASNEVAVDAFLQGRLKFTGIADTVSASLEHIELGASDSVEMILESDHRTRKFARRFIADRLIQQEQA